MRQHSTYTMVDDNYCWMCIFLYAYSMIILSSMQFINSFPLYFTKIIVYANISFGPHWKHLLHRLYPFIIQPGHKKMKIYGLTLCLWNLLLFVFKRNQFAIFLASYSQIAPKYSFALFIFQPVHSFSVRQRFYIHSKEKHFNLQMNFTSHNESITC